MLNKIRDLFVFVIGRVMIWSNKSRLSPHKGQKIFFLNKKSEFSISRRSSKCYFSSGSNFSLLSKYTSLQNDENFSSIFFDCSSSFFLFSMYLFIFKINFYHFLYFITNCFFVFFKIWYLFKAAKLSLREVINKILSSNDEKSLFCLCPFIVK